MYLIEFTEEAFGDLGQLRKFDQVRVVETIESQLSHEPTTQTRNRKRLRLNRLAEWALRIDNFRVFYDVHLDRQIVRVIAVGEKVGNELWIRGGKYEL
ncbi:MAG: type II toxin-antitoxin system RelE/ParE family toxin [Pirellulales bacterium]